MGRRPVLAVLLAAAAALCTVSAAAAKAPVVRAKQAPVRLTAALNGIQAAQWTNWWGTNSFTGGGVTLNSKPPAAASETHSALITTKRKWADSTVAVSTTTLKQLRRND